MLAGGRALWGFCLALAVALAGGCGLGGGDVPTPDGDDPPESRDDETTSTTEEGVLEGRDYDFADCVDWDPDGRPSPLGYLPTEVVPCTVTHQIQIGAREMAPTQVGYPTEEQWDTIIDDLCSGHGDTLRGGPLDPYGRFQVSALTPTELGWAEGDREVWCGVRLPGPDGGWAPMTEDVRGADQWYHWEVGQCVAFPPAVPAIQAVPCTQAHQMEITGHVEYTDPSQLPPASEADARCFEPTDAHVGGRLPDPWLYGSETVAPESWAAGLRFSHCFAGQWNPDGTNAAVSVSVRG